MQPVSGLEIEVGMFGQSVLMGILFLVAYDVIRIIRRVFRHGIIWVSIEDFLYWLVVGIWFFLHMCQVNNGIIRGYVLLGIVLGAWMYYRLCSRPLMRCLEKIIISIKKRLKKVRQVVTIRIEKLRTVKKPKESEKKDENSEKESS